MKISIPCIAYFQDLICSPSDVLEPRKQGTVRVAITVSELLKTTRWEMSQYVKGRGKIGDYLFELYEEFVQDFPGRSKAIWDLAPGAWIINSEWMKTEMTTSPILNDHLGYSRDGSRHPIKVVNWLDRDQIFKDFFTKLHNVTN